MKVTVVVAGRRFSVEVGDLNARPVIAEVDGERFEVWPDETRTASAAPPPPAAPVATVTLPGFATRADAAAVTAPLPGVVAAVCVEAGAQVDAGQEIVVIEAMKMKNAIRAPRAGRIDAVLVKAGQRVQHGETLVRYAPG